MKKKYFVSDLDGTLIHRQKAYLLPRTKECVAIRDFVQDGHYFIVATGRSYPDIETIMENINVPMGYAIAQNGALIYNEGELIHASYLSIDLIHAVLLSLKSLKVTYDYVSFTTDDYITYIKPRTIKGQIQKYRFSIRSNRVKKWHQHTFDKLYYNNNHPTKMIIATLDTAKLIKVEAHLKEQFGNQLSIYFSGRFSIEICASNVSKEKALRIIMEKESLLEEQVAFIGDSGNDSSIFKTLPNSYVMAHAPARFKIGYAKPIARVAHAVQDFKNKGDI